MPQRILVSARIYILIFSLGLFFSSLGQDCDSTVYEVVDEMPEFPGGMEKMYQFMADFTIPSVKMDNIQSQFYFEFIVQCDGTITHLRPLKNEDHPVTLAALEHLKKMPKWTPGKRQGIPVRVRYTLPVNIHWE